MSQNSNQETLTRFLRIVRIVILFLVVGGLTLTVLLILKIDQNMPDPEGLFFSYTALVYSAVILGVFRWVARKWAWIQCNKLSRWIKYQDVELLPWLATGTLTDRLAAIFNARTIIEASFLEGAAMIYLVAYLHERTIWSLFLTIAFVFSILLLYPSRAEMEKWINEQKTLLVQGEI